MTTGQSTGFLGQIQFMTTMGRRFAVGTDAAISGVLVAALLAAILIRAEPTLSRFAITIASPSVGGLVVIALCTVLPSLSSNGSPTRSDRVAMAVTHAALAQLAARALLTGANPTVAIHEQLAPATLWLHPLPLVVLAGGSIAFQELAQWRRRRPVS